jgi:transmembrane sensor
MTTPTPKSKLNSQIYEEACEWLVHFRAGDADDDLQARRQLDEWLRRSPEHVRAYLEVSTIWEDLPLHDAERKVDAESLIARARAEQNVYPLNVPDSTPDLTRVRMRRLPLALAASALLLIAVASTWLITQRSTYATAVGEQRSILLEDGSSVELNARSHLRVRFTARKRTVDLLEGQALFRVAKDKSRPFVVSSDDLRVTAVGTQFDVNRRKAATTVTVIEGRVAVDSLGTRTPPSKTSASAGPSTIVTKSTETHEVFLDAGQQLTVTSTAIAPPKRANVAATTAWTQQRLVFDSAPLGEVAEEFNRYNPRPIVIRDKTLESFGVIGVFSSTDPASLLTFMRAQPEIEVSEKNSEIWITRK